MRKPRTFNKQDKEFMDNIITHTLFIHRQKIRKTKGTSLKLTNIIKEEEVIYESTRKNQEKQRKKTEDWIDRFKAKATLASRAQSKLKMLESQIQIFAHKFWIFEKFQMLSASPFF